MKGLQFDRGCRDSCVVNAFYRRLKKTRYRIKRMRVFAVSMVKEGANLKRYVEIQKSIGDMQMPDNLAKALMTEAAKNAGSALLASVIQTSADVKDEIDKSEVGDETSPFPQDLATKMLGIADQITTGVQAMTGAPVEDDGPKSKPEPAVEPVPVEQAMPQATSQEDIAMAAEKMLQEALAVVKRGYPGQDVEKAKMNPKMSYKAFIGFQTTHMARLFDLLLEIAPFLMEMAETPAIQEALAAAESEAGPPSSQAGSAMVEPEAAVEMAKPEPMSKADLAEALSAALPAALAKALEPVNTMLTELQKSLPQTPLKKSFPASAAIAVEARNEGQSPSVGGSRDLAKEVREERKRAREGR